jgi:hypothetical protein
MDFFDIKGFNCSDVKWHRQTSKINCSISQLEARWAVGEEVGGIPSAKRVFRPSAWLNSLSFMVELSV